MFEKVNKKSLAQLLCITTIGTYSGAGVNHLINGDERHEGMQSCALTYQGKELEECKDAVELQYLDTATVNMVAGAAVSLILFEYFRRRTPNVDTKNKL